jgi:hypothetical protein
MKKIYIVLAGLFISSAASAQCSDIFISEVTEGSGNNKYMELYNGTGATVYLDDYGLANTSNAPTTVGEYEFWLSFPSGDSIANGSTYVIGHGSADSIIVANSNTSHNFLSNGDDGYKLVKGGTWVDANTDGDIDAGEMTGFTVVDAVGDWQGDPGAGWAVAGVVDATKDHTLVRKSWYGGNANWTASAGSDSAGSEWLVIDKDDWSGLGAHRSVCTGIQNAGYDIEGDDSYRDFWRNRDFEDQLPNTNLLQITSSPTHNGTAKAGKFPSSGDRIAYQAVIVKPMTNYIVKFWYTIKTSNVGSATVHILEGDIRDTANVAGAMITSKTVSDQTSANDYVLDSVAFTSGNMDVIAIYLRNEGEESRFDSWSIEEGEAAAPVIEPATAAVDPTHEAVDVISIYSQSYTDPAGINYFPGWGQTTQYADFAIGMDSMIKYSSLNYQGIDFNASEIDASSMEMLHIDIWTADVDDIDIFPISRASGEKAVKKTLIAGQWNSIDIPLTDYTSQGLSMSDIFQFKFDNLGASRDVGTIFIDNMYMWKEPTLVYKASSIADIVGLNADFYPVNYDTLYEVTGIVYGVDLQGGDDVTNDRLAFTIIDATDGVGVFAGSSLGYQVNEGDEVTVKGPLGFFNGLTQIIADSITVVSTGNTLKDATEVTQLSEATESDLVKFTKVWFVDNTITEWSSGNSDLTNGTDTFAVRIDSDTKGIVGSMAFDTMNIVGLGGQFDNSAPYDEGYQLFPMDSTYITEWVMIPNSVKEVTVDARVYPNPATNNLTVIGTQKWDTYTVFNILGGKVSEGTLTNNNLSVAELNSGTYIVKLYAGENTGVARFVVNK